MKNFIIKAASEIKNFNPRVASTTYNKLNLLSEIKKAEELNDREFYTEKELLRSKAVTAPSIKFFTQSLTSILNDTNEILKNKAEEHSQISRFENSREKREFAKLGLQLHQPGEICAFCGNIISKKIYNELKSYFSGEEIKNINEKCKSKIKEIQGYIDQISEVKINKNDFYPDYKEKIDELNSQYQEKSKKIIDFLSKLVTALKEKNLIESSPSVDVEIPEPLSEISNTYEKNKKYQ